MQYVPVKGCTGCASCSNICPVDAIKMKPDPEGFEYPDVDLSICTDCGACERACPVIHPPVTDNIISDCIVAQSFDDEVLDECTSGGFVDSLYRYVIEKMDGVGVGVSYGHDHKPQHTFAYSYDDAKAFRNSKYSQSSVGDVFRRIKCFLEEGKNIIFVGTPCQVAGLKAFLAKDYNTLLTVDLVCRSVPSPLLWQRYIEWQELRNKSKVEKVICRKKTYGYHSGALEIEFKNGKRYVGSNRVDLFMKSFHSDICSRRSCYDCSFKSPLRCSDLTVFDSWKPSLIARGEVIDNDRGFTNVILRTDKARILVRQLTNVSIAEADPERIFDFAGGMESSSIALPLDRESFYTDVENLGFEAGVKKHITVSLTDKVIEALKPVRKTLKDIRRRT